MAPFVTNTKTAAYAIHAEIHNARPDVLCAAHCHSVYGRAMCAMGKELDMLTQDFCTFYNDHVLYPYAKPLIRSAVSLPLTISYI